MVSKVVLSSESLPANVTGVRPLVRVGSFMDKQVVRFRELAIAVFANKLLLRPRTGNSWRSHGGWISPR